MTIGEKITKLRISKNMSQENLAQLLNVSRQAVSRWEGGDSIPHIDTLLQICDIFGITSDRLLREDVSIRAARPCMLDIDDENIVLKYFAADGFRGEANVELTSDRAYRIGRFLGWYYKRNNLSGDPAYRPRIVIGKDTRRSSYMLESAVSCGFAASGGDVSLLHVTTIPSVSYIVRQDNYDCGVMITASHNPYYDNGIKIINGDGEKIDDKVAYLIELYLDANLNALGVDGIDLPLATRKDIGMVEDYSSGRNRYIGYLISMARHSFRSLKIGLDCANGSAWMIAKSVFEALGAQTYLINNTPDGFNINQNAGSTHLEGLIRLVANERLDVGFAFDGDADRCLAIDERGNVVDGDKILYLLAKKFKEEGSLYKNTVVATSMSNSGLVQALKEVGIKIVTTDVGDRFVYLKMLEGGYTLGGEQSGHIIMKKYATTGDGILTAIMVVEAMLENKASLSALTSEMKVLPQKTKSIPVIDKKLAINDAKVQEAYKMVQRELGSKGRVLLRQSRTQPVLRITAECLSLEQCDEAIAIIEAAILEGGYVHE